MENSHNSKLSRVSRWILPITILISVIIVCTTILIIVFKTEIKDFITLRRAEQEIKASKEKEQAKNNLQFSREEREKLIAKQGTVSITDKPIEKILSFTHLGKPLPSPLPKGLESPGKRTTELAGLKWEEKGYDGFYLYAPKDDEKGFLSNKFIDKLVIYTKKGAIRRVRFLLRSAGKDSNAISFSFLKKEYQFLGYKFAQEYGYPLEQVYKIEKGYEDDEELAFMQERIEAYRIYKAKDGEIRIRLEYNEILVDYYLEE